MTEKSNLLVKQIITNPNYENRLIYIYCNSGVTMCETSQRLRRSAEL